MDRKWWAESGREPDVLTSKRQITGSDQVFGGSDSSLQPGSFAMPTRALLVGVRHAEQCGFAEGFAEQLKTDG